MQYRRLETTSRDVISGGLLMFHAKQQLGAALRYNALSGSTWLTIAIVYIGIVFSAPAWAGKTPAWAKQPRVAVHPGKISIEYLGATETDPTRYSVRIAGEMFVLFDGTIPPDYHTAQLLEYTRFQPGERVLEVGTGIGSIAVFAARAGAKVIATDIDPIAVANARHNAERLGVLMNLEVRQGDLFAPVREEKKFDVILFNVIYPFNDKTLHHWKLHERFFAEVGQYLAPGGKIYYQAGYLDNLTHIRHMVKTNKLFIDELHLMSVPQFRRQPMVFVIRSKPAWAEP